MRKIIAFFVLGFLLFGNIAYAETHPDPDIDPGDGSGPPVDPRAAKAVESAKKFGKPLCQVVNLSNSTAMAAVGGFLILTFLVQVLFGQFQMASFMKVMIGTTLLGILVQMTKYLLGTSCV
jgi:hypothetical protein